MHAPPSSGVQRRGCVDGRWSLERSGAAPALHSWTLGLLCCRVAVDVDECAHAPHGAGSYRVVHVAGIESESSLHEANVLFTA
jgi:hypothetical protein